MAKWIVFVAPANLKHLGRKQATDSMENNLTTAFDSLTKRVQTEPNIEKRALIMVSGVSDVLEHCKTNGKYPADSVDDFITALRTIGPMWAQAVAGNLSSTVGKREGASSGR